jgi:hypothetical protein
LGAHPHAKRTATTHELSPSCTLLLYTDGLIERRDEPIDESIRGLVEIVAGGTPEAVCARVTDRLVPHRGPTDDVAILAVRRA